MSIMMPVRLDRIDDKLDALEMNLIAFLPSIWTIGIGFVPYTERNKDELTAGVLNIVSAGEGNYHSGRGMAAKEGILRVHLIGHVQVDDDDPRADLQQVEIDMAEEIKSFVRAGVPGMTLELDSIEQSRLLEHPYGWVVAFIELQPPGANTH